MQAARARYVELPTASEGGQIEWARWGLQLVDLPPWLEEVVEAGDRSQTYRARRGRFFAEERVYSPTMSHAAVRLVEMHAAVSAEGQWTATAEIVLQPGSAATRCRLQLPPDARLLRLLVGDHPIPLRLDDSGRWQVPLGPPLMPRTITAVFTSTVDLSRRGTLLSVPRIEVGGRELPVPVSLWQLDAVPGVELGPEAESLRLDEARFIRQGLRHRFETVQDASALVFQLPDWEARQWFLPWYERLERATERWRLAENLLFGSASPADGEGTDEAELFGDETAEPGGVSWQTLVEAFGPLEPDRRAHRATHLLPTDPHDPQSACEGQQRLLAKGFDGMLQVRLAPVWQNRLGRWFLALLVLVAGAGVALVIWRKPLGLVDWVRWPQLAPLVAGFAWWAWLTPSALGPLIVVLTILALANRRWLSDRSSVEVHSVAERTRSILRLTQH